MSGYMMRSLIREARYKQGPIDSAEYECPECGRTCIAVGRPPVTCRGPETRRERRQQPEHPHPGRRVEMKRVKRGRRA